MTRDLLTTREAADYCGYKSPGASARRSTTAAWCP